MIVISVLFITAENEKMISISKNTEMGKINYSAYQVCKIMQSSKVMLLKIIL